MGSDGDGSVMALPLRWGHRGCANGRALKTRETEASRGLDDSSATHLDMGKQFEPRHAGRWSGDATLGESFTEALVHELLLMRHRVPYLDHHEMAIFANPRRVHQQSLGPVTLSSHVIDAQCFVHRVIFLFGDPVELQCYLSSHQLPPRFGHAEIG